MITQAGAIKHESAQGAGLARDLWHCQNPRIAGMARSCKDDTLRNENDFHANRGLHFTGKAKRGKVQNKKNILPV